MSDLQIHPASPAELIEAHRNVHDIWSKGLPIDEHVRLRLNSPSHSRATWYVGCLEGKVVASLGCYPLGFQLRGRPLRGIAIGSVYTRNEVRGRGFAPRLLAWVEQHERTSGAELSVLYSDIGADYYARLGYLACPSLEGWVNPDEIGEATSPLKLVPIAAAEHLPQLQMLYQSYHGAMPLSVTRTPEYWQAILLKFGDDRFYALVDSKENTEAGDWQGYLRIGQKLGSWRITDFALSDQTDELATRLYAAFLALAREHKVPRAGGWLPESVAARKFFTLVPRAVELTMVKPLVDLDVEAADLVGTSRFCEIDHV